MSPALMQSRIDSVQLYRRGAVVTRVATLDTLVGEEARVRFVDLPLILDDASVRLSSSPGWLLVDAAVALDAAERSSEHGSPHERELEELELAEARLRASLHAIDEAIARVESIAILGRPQGAEGEAPQAIEMPARLALIDFRGQSRAALARERRELLKQLRVAVAKRKTVAERIMKSLAARLPRPDELRKSVVATLRQDRAPAVDAPSDASAAPRPIALELSYFVPSARWAPSYLLRVDTQRKLARLELRAMVQQSTDEDWSDVAVTFSTAHAMRHHELPELASLRIGRAQSPVRKRTWRPVDCDPAELFADYERALAEPAAHAERAAELDEEEEHDDVALDLGIAKDEPDVKTRQTMVTRRARPASREDENELAAAEFSGISDFLSAASDEAGDAAAGFGGAPPPAARPSSATVSAPRPMSAQEASRSRAEDQVKARLPRRAAEPLLARLSKSANAPQAAAPGAPPVIEVDDRLLEYGALRMPPPESRRGKLQVATLEARYVELSVSLQQTEIELGVSQIIARAQQEQRHAPAPARHFAPESVDGFDHVLEGTSRVDVPSDTTFHSLPISEAEAALVLRHVVVPRESADVFRFVELDNPLDAPLLRGPCDVYFDREFLLTTDLATVPPRGRVRAGLGVDQSIKAARNSSYGETTSGLMSGSLALRHTIAVELSNQRSEVAEIEVRERVPVALQREEDIKVELLEVKPGWQPWEAPPDEPPVKGAFAWRVRVEPGAKATLSATYVVKLPAKYELVGGNRRD